MVVEPFLTSWPPWFAPEGNSVLPPVTWTQVSSVKHSCQIKSSIQMTLLIWLPAEFTDLRNLSAKTRFLWHHHWWSHNVLAIKRVKKVYPFSRAQSSKVSCISKKEFRVYRLLKNIHGLYFRNLPLYYYSINPTN